MAERFAGQHPGDEDAVKNYIRGTLPVVLAIHRYTELQRVLADSEHARRDRDRALHLVEVRWEALSTAASWPAAHHAYVVAVDEARAAIGTWAAKVAVAAQADGFTGDASADITRVYRERILTQGHPAVEPPNHGDNEARVLREELDRLHEHRRELAAQTLTFAQPASQ